MNRVSLYKCDDYEYAKVKECVRKAFDDFGGIKILSKTAKG